MDRGIDARMCSTKMDRVGRLCDLLNVAISVNSSMWWKLNREIRGSVGDPISSLADFMHPLTPGML